MVAIAPNERYAVLGKTGSGKTTFGMFLASLLVPADPRKANGWEVWWLDTKGDAKDIKALGEWGYVTKGRGARRMIHLRPGRDSDVVTQAQEVCLRAMRQGGVLIVVDEYTQVCKSTQSAGPGLLDVFTRGRGLNVGIIGHTQEPVYIPRQLISQASHVMIFDQSYPYDVAYVREYLPTYQRPLMRGDRYGFYHGAIDQDALWAYYASEYAWHRSFTTEGIAA